MAGYRRHETARTIVRDMRYLERNQGGKMSNPHDPKTVTIIVEGTPHAVPKNEDIT